MRPHRRLSPGDPPRLADLGVNAGRQQRRGGQSAYYGHRVIIDIQRNGCFTVYADPDVQVICRCAHIPDDELVQVDQDPIPEDWFDGPVGRVGDGSVADLLAEVLTDWSNGGPA